MSSSPNYQIKDDSPLSNHGEENGLNNKKFKGVTVVKLIERLGLLLIDEIPLPS